MEAKATGILLDRTVAVLDISYLYLTRRPWGDKEVPRQCGHLGMLQDCHIANKLIDPMPLPSDHPLGGHGERDRSRPIGLWSARILPRNHSRHDIFY